MQTWCEFAEVDFWQTCKTWSGLCMLSFANCSMFVYSTAKLYFNLANLFCRFYVKEIDCSCVLQKARYENCAYLGCICLQIFWCCQMCKPSCAMFASIAWEQAHVLRKLSKFIYLAHEQTWLVSFAVRSSYSKVCADGHTWFADCAICVYTFARLVRHFAKHDVYILNSSVQQLKNLGSNMCGLGS